MDPGSLQERRQKTEAVVNMAGGYATAGAVCDSDIYRAAGADELLSYRTEKTGFVPEGEAFITPGFHLHAKYIIHVASPLYKGESNGEEEKLRSCYRKSLLLAKENGISSIAFPLISTGGVGHPKEEGLRISRFSLAIWNRQLRIPQKLFPKDMQKNAGG